MKLRTTIAAIFLAACTSGLWANGNINNSTTTSGGTTLQRLGILNKLETGVTVGTTGLGIEIATPVTEWVKVRAGFSYMPRISVPLHFGITAYTDGTSVNSGNFGKIQNLMHQLSGYTIDDRVDVDGIPTMLNFKFLVDVYPFKNNRHWHATVGFYAGPRRIAKAINTMEEMPSLLAIGMYNRLYDATQAPDFVENMIDKSIGELFGMSSPSLDDVYLDPAIAVMLQEKLAETGRIGVHLGDFRDGKPYYMVPDKDGTVRANAYVNTIRWYTGAGYNTAVSKDGRWNIGVDFGVMFWGGAPRVVTHEGIDMTNDLVNIRGKVGDYMDIMRTLKVFPTVEFKLTYTFF